MRKLGFLLVAGGLLVTSLCYGVQRVGGAYKLYDGTAVASATTVTSANVEIGKHGEFFGVWYQATSVTGTADVRIIYKESYNETAADFVVPENTSDVTSSVSDEAVHVKLISPVPMQFLNFEIIGIDSNPADTVVTLILFEQES